MRIISLCLQAPLQRLADRIASWFVPGIIFIALLTFLAWTVVVLVTAQDAQVGTIWMCVCVCVCKSKAGGVYM